MESFGQRVKRLRDKADLSQRGLASLVGVTGATISNWENDVPDPKGINDEFRQNLELALNTTFLYLLTGQDLRVSAEGILIEKERPKFMPIPLLNFEHLALFLFREMYPDLDINKISEPIFPPPNVGTLSADAYAFVAPDDSLVEYPTGSIVIADPQVPAKPSKPIVAIVHGEPFLRIYNLHTSTAEGKPVFSIEPTGKGHPTFSSDLTDIRFAGSVRGHWEPAK